MFGNTLGQLENEVSKSDIFARYHNFKAFAKKVYRSDEKFRWKGMVKPAEHETEKLEAYKKNMSQRFEALRN